MKTISLDGESLAIEDVVAVAKSWVAAEGIHVKIPEEAREKIERGRRAVEEFAERAETIHGVTTGLGALKDIMIWPSQSEELQRNTLMSQAVGVGDPFDEDVTVRALFVI